MSGYRSPILCTIYRVLSGLAGTAAVIILLVALLGQENALAKASALGSFFICLIASVILYGIAQVIDLIGKTAFFSQRSAETQDFLLAELRRAGPVQLLRT